MTKIKLCGLTRPEDITAANVLEPDFVGFVFAPKSRRYVTGEQAGTLRKQLSPTIQAVGVFVDEEPERVAALLEAGIIDLAQLHGREDEGYLERLRTHRETHHPGVSGENPKGPGAGGEQLGGLHSAGLGRGNREHL